MANTRNIIIFNMMAFTVMGHMPALRSHMAVLTSALQSRNAALWGEIPEVVAIRGTLRQLTEIIADVGRVVQYASVQTTWRFDGPDAQLLPEASVVFAAASDDDDDSEDDGFINHHPGFVASDEDDDSDSDSDFDPFAE